MNVPAILKEGIEVQAMNDLEMSDPEMKIEEIEEVQAVPVVGPSGWNGPQKAASATPATGNIVPWPQGALPFSLRSMRAQAEIYAITRALEEAGWNRKRAAQMLRISYRGLLYKISSHKITRRTAKAQSLGAEGIASFATNEIK